MVHGSQNRGSWASWGPTIIFSEKKSPYLNNLSLDHMDLIVRLLQKRSMINIYLEKIIKASLRKLQIQYFLQIYICLFPINVRQNFWFIWYFSSTCSNLCRSLTQVPSCQKFQFVLHRRALSSLTRTKIVKISDDLQFILQRWAFSNPKKVCVEIYMLKYTSGK